MDKFQQGFINEAKDLLASLESALLSLEDDKENKEMISEIFKKYPTNTANTLSIC